MLKIREFAKLAQVSVRLLHYYDQIGLLPPARIDGATSYRYYSVDQLPRLNRILALRDLGLSLNQITSMMSDAISAEEIRGILRLRQAELRDQIARDQARLVQAEMRLRNIELEGQMPVYDVITKRVTPEHALTAEITLPKGKTLTDFYRALWAMLREAGIIEHVTALIGVYRFAFVVDVKPLPQRPFVFRPAFAIPPEYAAPFDAPGWGRLEPDTLTGYEAAAITIHEGPYNRLFAPRIAIYQWAEAHGFHPSGMVREVYLRDERNGQPPLVEVQMPLHPVKGERTDIDIGG